MDYQLHDISRFPFVELVSERCTQGFAAGWGREMDALLAARTPFVVAFEPAAIDEDPADFRERALWFKANRGLLGGNCAAMVCVVPAAEERAAIRADLARRSRGFDVRYAALASFVEAQQQTAAFIEDDRLQRLRDAA